ncbi:type II secretion system F family protein [Candidatus Woesearchaeota archaeon]|nr:type II secretion system F family protein [Candidatus Woesearchaeota archaeon]
MLFHKLATYFPLLGQHLRVARIDKSSERFLKEAVFSSLVFSLAFFFVFLIISLMLSFSPAIAFVAFFIILFFTFYAFINRPQYNALKAEQVVESEIVSAVRFLILELRSERSLYGAITNVSRNFSLIGIYFDEIIDKVKMGKTLEQALNEAVELCPSPHLRNVYWQLLNSLQTGADITSALQVLLDDIIESQKIHIQEYGRELNALSLFYMMVSIIIPTVGFTIITAVLTFIGFPIGIGLLIGVWVLLSIVQYFFLMIAAHRRPTVEAY